MSLVVSWIGIDTHGPTSAYIVSDSRLSWPNGNYFDYGKKVFASNVYPEVFGYAGDVLFPTIVLGQILTMIDTGVLFNNTMTCDQKNKIVFEKILYSLDKYPNELGDNPVQIIHISRDTIVEKWPKFHQYTLLYQKGKKPLQKEINIPKSSDVLTVLGSAKTEFNDNYIKRYQEGENKSTSRNVFHCFVDTLRNTNNTACGGPPQLVGIYRKPDTAAQNFGIISDDKRYLLGMEIPKESVYDQVEWRNEDFELCSGETKKRKENAMKQPDPLRRT